ncbi:MAG: glutamate-5-semialdehyde dehydrogenase, partial [Polyangia bacterium]
MTDIEKLARDAKTAGRLVAKAGAERRTAGVSAIADAIERHAAAILAANAEDLAAARKNGLAPAMVDRLLLDDKRIAKMAAAVREVAAQPDPIGQAVKQWTRPNGLKIARRRIPLGVIAIIYESRPNVTTDAAALCLRAGNAVILRGGSEAFRSNQALMHAVAAGLEAAGLPPTAVQLVPTTERAAMAELLQRDEEIDLVIPRGGVELIRFVAEHSRIPVIKHYRGNCHVFVEASADPGMALEICYNSKVQRPGVCNAAETILIDEAIAHSFLPQLAER